MQSNQHPKFAVVGHPNKGKSSIVSSLAMDDSVQISNTPGTTTKKRSFPLKVDGKVLYELFDTPGFQRARRVLAWLKEHNVPAHKRYEVVKKFIVQHKDNPRFNDEIELLEPIMSGAGIIYVVDGSKPYGDEYEAEMEILRWTGQPSMALINHIDKSDYSQDWKMALGQYFKMVRTFDPMNTSLEQHLAILESMAQLKEEWIAPVKESIKLFEAYHEQMLRRSALEIRKLLYSSLSLVEKLPFKDKDATDKQKSRLQKRYKDILRKKEVETQKNIESIWNHSNLQKEQQELSLESIDLFSQESASIFGLSKKELLIMATASGAATGAGVDLLFGGSTFFLGSSLGALVGGIGAFFAFDELSEVKVLGQTIGNKYLEMGPMRNRNFPYILLGRAIYHTKKVSNRSHALRNIADLKMDNSFKDSWLSDEVKKSLEPYHKLFRSGRDIDIEILNEYEDILYEIIKS